MIWSPWKALHSGIPPGQADEAGLIDDSLLPATHFQLRYWIHFEIDSTQIADVGEHVGRWRWQIVDESGQPLFDQTNPIKITYTLFFGTYAWWVVPAHTRVRTEVPQPVYMLGHVQGGTPQVTMGTVSVPGGFEQGFDALHGVACDLKPEVMHARALTVNASMRTSSGGVEVATGTVPAGGTAQVPLVGASNSYVGCSGASWSGGFDGDRIGIVSREWVYVEAETGYCIPAGGSDLGLGIIRLDFDYYAAAYEMALPLGAHVKVPFHNIGGTMWSPKYEDIQIRTVKGGGIAAMVDRPGFLRSVVPDPKKLVQVVSDDFGETVYRRQVTRLSPSAPCILKTPENHLLVGTFVGQVYSFLISRDDGRTFETLDYWRGQAVSSQPWSSDYTEQAGICTKTGVIVTVARRGTTLYAKTSDDGFTTAVMVGGVNPEPYALGYDSERDTVYAIGAGSIFASRDVGRSWFQTAGLGL